MTIKSSYGYAFKLSLVEEALSSNKSVSSLSKSHGLSDSLLRKWIDQYTHYGPDGLILKEKKLYSNEYKLGIILDFHNNKLTLRECCLKYHIAGFSTLFRVG